MEIFWSKCAHFIHCHNISLQNHAKSLTDQSEQIQNSALACKRSGHDLGYGKWWIWISQSQLEPKWFGDVSDMSRVCLKCRWKSHSHWRHATIWQLLSVHKLIFLQHWQQGKHCILSRLESEQYTFFPERIQRHVRQEGVKMAWRILEYDRIW